MGKNNACEKSGIAEEGARLTGNSLPIQQDSEEPERQAGGESAGDLLYV